MSLHEHSDADWQSVAAHAHHADLWSELTQREAALVRAVLDGTDHHPAQQSLVEVLRSEVLPHLATEEEVLYSAARGAGAHALVASLEVDHRALLSAVEHVEHARTALDAALATRALVALFALRMEKEETVLLPTLAAARVDPGSLLQGRPEMVGPRAD